VNELDIALAGIVSLRRRGSIHADLAMTGVQSRDSGQILEHAADAIAIAEQTRSVGYLGRKLAGVWAGIQPLLADHRMTELNERINRLLAGT
jgi:hypothetical protein